MPLGDVGQARHVGADAVHAEHALGEDEPARPLAGAGRQQALKMIQVVMPETHLPRACGLAAVMQTGMDQPVGEHQRRSPARPGGQQRRNHRGIGLPARAEHQRRLAPLGCRQLGLHGFVDLEGPGHQARGAGSRSVPAGPVLGALDQRRMARQAQVVVGADVDQFPPAGPHAPVAQRLDGPQAPAPPRWSGPRPRKGDRTWTFARPGVGPPA